MGGGALLLDILSDAPCPGRRSGLPPEPALVCDPLASFGGSGAFLWHSVVSVGEQQDEWIRQPRGGAARCLAHGSNRPLSPKWRLTPRVQWTAGFSFCLMPDALGPPPLTRIVGPDRHAQSIHHRGRSGIVDSGVGCCLHRHAAPRPQGRTERHARIFY